MPTHSTDQIPPGKDNWSLEDEGYEKVTAVDYHGNEYIAWVKKPKGVNLSKAWKQFSQDFRSQPTRDITGRSNSFNPPLEQIDYNNTDPYHN